MTHAKQPDGFADLRALSAEFGGDRMHVQGAGGNSSIKQGDVMWIKASGTQLADAERAEIFVPVDLPRMIAALQADDPTADQPAEFLIPGTSALRPSIETSLHAVFAQRIVFHSHCIHTLAHAVRQDARRLLEQRLSAFDWAYVPYAKPGANLARSVKHALSPETNVVILGNHGLIVATDTIDELRSLQTRIHAALSLPAAPEFTPDLPGLAALCEGSDYVLPDDAFVHQLALDPDSLRQITGGSLYPDHVIFCGIAVTALKPGETPGDAVRHAAKLGAPDPVFLALPGQGVIIRQDATQGAQVMIRCLADVMARVPGDAALSYLTTKQNLELLNWDAEKYRQALNAG